MPLRQQPAMRDVAQPTARPRPPLFRALGASDPPLHIEIDGIGYRRLEILKHDSWAATAIYVNGPRRVVCKFNRQQPILGLPARWLGRCLARRETAMLERLADVPNVPASIGPVRAHGQTLDYVSGHDYVPGHPLGLGEKVSAKFFPELRAVIEEMHRRGLAYVDLHKRENILVGKDGRPYLIDFQISLALPASGPLSWLPCRFLLSFFQKSDLYHLAKHERRSGPAEGGATLRRPWWIQVHRLIAQPFRTVRRRLLVALNIRSGKGRVGSEHFPEDVVRRDAA
jgi:hypothetical protein